MLRTYFDVRGGHLIENAPCLYHFFEKKALKIVKFLGLNRHFCSFDTVSWVLLNDDVQSLLNISLY